MKIDMTFVTLLLVVLKLTGVIHWSWLVVFMPLIVMYVISSGFLMLGYLIMGAVNRGIKNGTIKVTRKEN